MNQHEKGSIVCVPVAAAGAEAAEAEAIVVVAVVTAAAAGHTRLEPGRHLCACVSSIKPLKMASRISSCFVFFGLNQHEKGSIICVPVAAAEAAQAEATVVLVVVVVAVVTAAVGHTRPGLGQRRRACVSSINPLKIATRICS